MSNYFKNIRNNSTNQHKSRVDNIGIDCWLIGLMKSSDKHRPRGKCFLKMLYLETLHKMP